MTNRDLADKVNSTARIEERRDVKLWNVTCSDCGQHIPWYYGPKDDILCYRCRHPLSYRWRGGGTEDPEWETDQSGASSSWDMVVRAYEDIPDNVRGV